MWAVETESKRMISINSCRLLELLNPSLLSAPPPTSLLFRKNLLFFASLWASVPSVYSLPFHTSSLSPCHAYPFKLPFLWASLDCLCPVLQQVLAGLSTLPYNIRCMGMDCIFSCLYFWPELLGMFPLRSRVRPQADEVKEVSCVSCSIPLSSWALVLLLSLCCLCQSLYLSQHEPSQNLRCKEKGIPPSLLSLLITVTFRFLVEVSSHYPPSRCRRGFLFPAANRLATFKFAVGLPLLALHS